MRPDKTMPEDRKQREIVRAYLLESGHDGLYQPSLALGRCACGLNDLLRCGGSGESCWPGYLVTCDGGQQGIGGREGERPYCQPSGKWVRASPYLPEHWGSYEPA